MIHEHRCQNCSHWVPLNEMHFADLFCRDVAATGGCIGKPREHLQHARVDGDTQNILIVTPFDWSCAGWAPMPAPVAGESAT